MERNWEEVYDGSKGAPVRWNMTQAGHVVEGAFIEPGTNGGFNLHFPRLVPCEVDSLEEAKRILERAPLASSNGISIGCALSVEQADDLIDVDTAAEMLGVSRWRVNAMVANGSVSASRTASGLRISRESVEKRASGGESNGPCGRFAHRFLQYFPDKKVNAFHLIEVDDSDEIQMRRACDIIDAIDKDKGHLGAARLLDYRDAMRLRRSPHRIGDAAGDGGFVSLGVLALEAFLSGRSLSSEAAFGSLDRAGLAGA